MRTGIRAEVSAFKPLLKELHPSTLSGTSAPRWGVFHNEKNFHWMYFIQRARKNQ